MKLEEFKKQLDTSGLPSAYNSFPENSVPELPYVCYSCINSSNFFADGIVYFGRSNIEVKLYTKNKDVTIEEKVEKALSSFIWEKSEMYVDDEQCLEITYTMEV